jgi:adenylate cyclase
MTIKNQSIKNMAVLFTDIVGSSNFFKKHGNVSGRSMLKLHQDIASPLVAEFGGAVVKLLGDSVMAYFLDPADAFKSAIKIQQKFTNHNIGKAEKDQIHIRLCVHYGEGIVEDKDIFGDVVNMAAKFLPFAGSDQILISEEVYTHVKDIPMVHFQRVDLTSEKRVLN